MIPHNDILNEKYKNLNLVWIYLNKFSLYSKKTFHSKVMNIYEMNL